MLKKDLFQKGKCVAVALSGGEDSVCLFHLLLANAEDLGITVKAINVEHGLRGEKSVADSLFVKRLCERFSVPLFFEKVDSSAYSATYGTSKEESARTLRYGVFFKAIDEGFCDAVATAHHLSDNAETVLFDLFRGTGTCTGIQPSSYGGKIIRPLLDAPKSAIHEYALKNHLDFVFDETNDDDLYTRNFIRLKVLPLVKSRFPEAESALSRYSLISSEENEFLDAQAKKILKTSGNEFYLPSDAEEVLFRRGCILALKGLGIEKDYEKRHIDALIDLKNRKSGTKIDLPQGVKAIKDYGGVTILRFAANEVFSPVKFEVKDYFAFGKTVVFTKKEAPVPPFLRFDGDKIPKTAVVRTREKGDIFTKFGGGTKKLKDYFIDKKIPARERDRYLLVADGQNILLICGLEISDLIKVDKDTQNVIQCYTE
ncbi:MAG: tRNA lysidine(34) synthetase TilS [Clostridia bacterium]|nr:tRNA lysidine(34) synthetase TilS [Clostridia bacterium]